MNITKSNTYVLKWQVADAPQYKFTHDGKCFNTMTGNEIRRVMVGRSVGYCVPKFQSLNTIRKKLQKIPQEKIPF